VFLPAGPNHSMCSFYPIVISPVLTPHQLAYRLCLTSSISSLKQSGQVYRKAAVEKLRAIDEVLSCHLYDFELTRADSEDMDTQARSGVLSYANPSSRAIHDTSNENDVRLCGMRDIREFFKVLLLFSVSKSWTCNTLSSVRLALSPRNLAPNLQFWTS
jgi:hypothetical protein